MTDINYSDTIKMVLKEGSILAKDLGKGYVDARHIFIALYTVHKGVAYSVMLKSGLRAEDFQKLAALSEADIWNFNRLILRKVYRQNR